MIFFLSIIGFCVTALIFLYFLQIEEKIKKTIEKQSKKKKIQSKGLEINTHGIISRARNCPVCKIVLLSSEYLICSMEAEENSEKKRQVHIYGCPHCFTSEDLRTPSSSKSFR